MIDKKSYYDGHRHLLHVIWGLLTFKGPTSVRSSTVPTSMEMGKWSRIHEAPTICGLVSCRVVDQCRC
jgi:hypothetical protein